MQTKARHTYQIVLCVQDAMLLLIRLACEATGAMHGAMFFIDREVNKVQRFEPDPKEEDGRLQLSKEVVIKKDRNGLADECMFKGCTIRRPVDADEGHMDFFGYDINEKLTMKNYCFVPVMRPRALGNT